MRNRFPFFGALLFVITTSSFAVDIPNIDMNAQKFDSSECVSENADECIDDQCETSEAIDCESQCRSMAEAKCEQQALD